jgi:predicted Zn-dependent peptidase
MKVRAHLGVFAGAATIAAATALVAAQAPQPADNTTRLKGKAPVSNTVLRVSLPKPQEADLPNGLHVMVLEDPRAPQVTVQMAIRGAGGYYDPADHFGLAQFTAANLREGTAKRTSPEIAENLERIAATVNVTAAMSSEEATLTASALREHFDQVMDLAAEVVLTPAFPEQELARYKAQTRAQLMQQRAQPNFLAFERFSQVVAEGHPDGRMAPTIEAVEKTTRDSLVAFHKSHYVPDHAVIAITGDITMAAALKAVQSRFGGWAKSGAAPPTVSDPVGLADPGVFLVARPNSVQTSLVVGVQAIRYLDADFYAMTVLNKIIGGGPTGRLFRHLREEKGYTYGAGSQIVARRYRGTWMASTNVRSEVTEPALRDLLDELRQAREIRVPDQEFADAKRSLVAAFALEIESPQAALNNALTRWRYGLPADYWDRYPERIMAITQDEAQAMARKYLDPKRLQIVAVGDRAVAEDVLKKLGRLQVFDAEGKKVQ